MKILVIQGSPHKEGSSNILAEQFQAGAEKAGHEVSVFVPLMLKLPPVSPVNTAIPKEAACAVSRMIWST